MAEGQTGEQSGTTFHCNSVGCGQYFGTRNYLRQRAGGVTAGLAAYLPTAPQIELNLKIIKDNLYPLIELLRRLEPKQHKAALKHMRSLLNAVGYSWWIVPGEDLAAKGRNENWQRRRWAKDSEAREALAAIVINIAGNKRPLHPYDWIGKKLKMINNKLIRVGHSPLVANFDDAKDVRKASDDVHRILTDLPADLSRS